MYEEDENAEMPHRLQAFRGTIQKAHVEQQHHQHCGGAEQIQIRGLLFRGHDGRRPHTFAGGMMLSSSCCGSPSGSDASYASSWQAHEQASGERQNIL